MPILYGPHYSPTRLTQRPVVKPYWKLRPKPMGPEGGKSWKLPDLCKAYNWPAGLGGGGIIAIVELGGGWVAGDMQTFFGDLEQPLPSISDISVDGTQNMPDPSPKGADGEVTLDIQIAGAAYFLATGKAATIRIYWSRDIASAVRAATADSCDVCSISWGADETDWGEAAARDMEQAAADATAGGMIVFAASGDNDSSDGGPNAANIDLPSSAPHVIGCGGTRKTADVEVVWNNQPGKTSGHGTGGGFSTLFKPMPDWQAGAPHGPGRMVPDVAANADPETGYEIVLHGAQAVIGGTSAVAPLYAGLFASFGTKLGFVAPELWLNHLCFSDIVDGDNGAFRARIGADPCTGLGSPIGKKLADLLTHPAATPARRARELAAENTRLRETIAQLTDDRLAARNDDGSLRSDGIKFSARDDDGPLRSD